MENGANWVGHLLGEFADVYKKMPQAFDEDPVAAFKRNIYVNPFWEDDLSTLADLVGADHILFGSDFPHPEGLGEPTSYINDLGDLSDEDKVKVMGGNLSRLMNVAVTV